MTIINIDHDKKKATVALQYNDIRDINTLLCEAGNISDLRRSFFLLFELVKNGCVDRFTVEHLGELLLMEDSAKEGEEYERLAD